MALDRQIARPAKIFVDSEDFSFDEAQAKLRELTLEIVVGPEATSPAAHAAILTAVSVAKRTFVGGVRVTGATDGPLNSALPLGTGSFSEAVALAGASDIDCRPSRKIFVGSNKVRTEEWSVSPWWKGWRAGISKPEEVRWDAGNNPLPGIAAGGLAVCAAFEAERKRCVDFQIEIDLWPVGPDEIAPPFEEVFLPGAFWLVGLGNLGQAFLWALAALPYMDPADVSVVVQDYDKVTEENWGTSVLVGGDTYGVLKTRVAERWALDKGFDVRRIDRRLVESDRLDNDDPRLALSGVDKVEARKLMAKVGFDCVVDAGLGGTASDFDKYRVTVFDRSRRIDEHFADLSDEPPGKDLPNTTAYQRLETEIGSCGMAEISGASVAVPYVSAVAAAIAISRTIAVASGCACPINEVGKLPCSAYRKLTRSKEIEGRGIRRAGKPDIKARK